MREGISLTKIRKNAFNPGKNNLMIFNFFLKNCLPSHFGPLKCGIRPFKDIFGKLSKMREGILITQNPKKAVNPGKNGRQNLKNCQMFCNVKIADAYTIHVTHQLTLNAHCGSCI